MSCPCENNNNTMPNVPCTGQSTCIEIISSDCISYVGTEKKCGTDVVYENGDSLSTVQSKIVDYICDKTSLGHYIGEQFGGGVIFHLYYDSNGIQHGLITSIANQSQAQYSNILMLSIGASSSWNGLNNTNLMAAQSGVTLGAWKVCQDYSYGGFTDWYLPSFTELQLLQRNLYNINRTLGVITGSQELDYNSNYWTSTEFSNANAWVIQMNSSGAGYYNKDYVTNVRAIRQF